MQKVVYNTLDSFLPRPTSHLANINTQLPYLMTTHLSVLYLLNLQTHSVPAAHRHVYLQDGQRRGKKEELTGIKHKSLVLTVSLCHPWTVTAIVVLIYHFYCLGGVWGGPQCVICPVGGNYTPMALWSSWLCIWLAGQSAPFKGTPPPPPLLSLWLSTTDKQITMTALKGIIFKAGV